MGYLQQWSDVKHQVTTDVQWCHMPSNTNKPQESSALHRAVLPITGLPMETTPHYIYIYPALTGLLNRLYPSYLQTTYKQTTPHYIYIYPALTGLLNRLYPSYLQTTYKQTTPHYIYIYPALTGLLNRLYPSYLQTTYKQTTLTISTDLIWKTHLDNHQKGEQSYSISVSSSVFISHI